MERNIKFKFNWILRNKIAIGTAPMNEDDTKILKDFGIEKIVRDLRVHEILEGTNEIMQLIIARRILN